MRRASITLALLFFAIAPAFAHDPGVTKIDAAAKKQLPVPFDHAKHGDKLVKSCDTCHHTHKGLTKAQADKVDVQKCSACHLDPKDANAGKFLDRVRALLKPYGHLPLSVGPDLPGHKPNSKHTLSPACILVRLAPGGKKRS